ncbi:DUF805 domain-containing protein [Niveibacterium sp. 24ML]|uniref:DUF805 domain-containing protein n=1 Tax=Niveibacterium sp. 24ML TaxID=2985512 RepID=UPI002271B07E|nr:DUF805 domain-containing protein [Niveibacterium sp. 24ML]MCX9158021.1 DUF805 domain-containing protein [Niveibacterium sp. 24ML]
MTQNFRVILTGNVLPGHDAAAVRGRIAEAFRLTPAQLDTVFSGRRVAVKRDATPGDAQRLVMRIRELGLSAEIEPMPAPAAVIREREAAAAAPVATAPVPPLPPLISDAPPPDELFSLAAPSPQPAATPAAPAPSVASTAAANIDPAPEEVTCPQCSEVQPKRTLCRACGTDMPRLRAAREALVREMREARESGPGGPRTTMSGFGPSTTYSTRGGQTVMSRNGPATRFAGDGEDAPIAGFGFSGRFNRSTYIAASVYSLVAIFLFALLAALGKLALLSVVGMLVASIYSIRCVVLRLHDMGRTGWLTLLLCIPVVNFVMTLILLFVRGNDGLNDHGPEPSVGGAKPVLLSLAVLAVSVGLVMKSMPGSMSELAQQYGQAEASTGDERALPDVSYAPDNRIVMYSMAGCEDCDAMRDWLRAEGLRFSDYAVDSDQAAADQLSEKLAGMGGGNVQLPVMEINGKLMPNNPSPAAVRAKLRTL